MKLLSIFLYFLSAILISFPSHAQMGANHYNLDFESKITGGNNSDVSVQSVGFQKQLFKVLFKKGQKGIFNTSLNYKYAHLNFNSNKILFSDLENFNSVGVNFSYIRRMNQKWSFIGMLNPQLSSNFTGKLTADDFYLNIIGLLNYSRKANNRLTFGLVYSNSMGVPFPIPVISYWHKFNDKWQMNLGFPRLGMTYSLNPTSDFSGYIEFAGMNANISQNISDPMFKEGRMAEQINYNAIISGIEYHYHISKLQIKLNIGYSLGEVFELQDSNNDTAYEFEMGNNINIGIGVGFKI